jgi:transcriptional regulator with XRE-family HTH domain
MGETTPAGRAQFGRRLRSLRLADGQSQVQLAGEALSPSYVSLLEAGKRMPTTNVVTLLAARLRCDPGFLLDGDDPREVERVQLSLRYAELALRSGEARDALTQLNQLLEPDRPLPDDLRWDAQRLRASALEACGLLTEALPVLEELRAVAEATSRREDQIRLTIDLVRCYKELGDISHALDVGQSMLAHVADIGLIGSDLHAELASTVIGIHYERGDLARASLLADEAMAAVGANGSSRARAAVYWNASLTAEANDNLTTAMQWAERALMLYAAGDDARALSRLQVAYGWLLLRTTPPRAEEARAHLQLAHHTLLDVGSAVDIAYCETELGRCAVLLGEPESALDFAEAAAHRLGDETQLQTAHTRLIAARALLAAGRRDEAVLAYREAGQMLGSLDLSRQAASAWRELADAFAQLGLLEDAAMAYQQALSDAGVRAAPDVTYTETALHVDHG